MEEINTWMGVAGWRTAGPLFTAAIPRSAFEAREHRPPRLLRGVLRRLTASSPWARAWCTAKTFRAVAASCCSSCKTCARTAALSVVISAVRERCPASFAR
ncbi:hypothetical protein RI054_26g108800 [Pseudoscourfieldia marina]